MITGSHAIIYAEDAEKARAFFRDVLGLSLIHIFSCSDAETCAVIDTPINQAPGQPARWAITTDGGVHWSRSTVPMPAAAMASTPSISCLLYTSRCV